MRPLWAFPSLFTSHLTSAGSLAQTIIMHDPVQGKDLGNILNDLLTERAFGIVDTSAEGDSQWRWNGRSALQQPPAPAAEHEVSFGAFLRAKVGIYRYDTLQVTPS